MNTIPGITISPVHMEDRVNLGIKAGDTVRVHQKIKDDKGKVRLQVFEGLVLARKHGNEPGATFTVRKVVDGIGVEKIFPLFTPLVDKIEIVKRSTVRRAKLYHIREKVAREIKRQMRRMRLMTLSSESGIEVEARALAEAKAAEEAAKAAEAARQAEEAAKAAEAAAKAQAEAEKAAAEATNVEEAAPVTEETVPASEEKKDEVKV